MRQKIDCETELFIYSEIYNLCKDGYKYSKRCSVVKQTKVTQDMGNDCPTRKKKIISWNMYLHTLMDNTYYFKTYYHCQSV